VIPWWVAAAVGLAVAAALNWPRIRETVIRVREGVWPPERAVHVAIGAVTMAAVTAVLAYAASRAIRSPAVAWGIYGLLGAGGAVYLVADAWLERAFRRLLADLGRRLELEYLADVSQEARSPFARSLRFTIDRDVFRFKLRCRTPYLLGPAERASGGPPSVLSIGIPLVVGFGREPPLSTRITLYHRSTARPVAVHPKGRIDPPTREPAVGLDDPSFEREFWVLGSAEGARSLLAPDVRRRLVHGRRQLLGVTAGQYGVSVYLDGRFTRADEVLDWLALARALDARLDRPAGRLPGPPEPGARRPPGRGRSPLPRPD